MATPTPTQGTPTQTPTPTPSQTPTRGRSPSPSNSRNPSRAPSLDGRTVSTDLLIHPLQLNNNGEYNFGGSTDTPTHNTSTTSDTAATVGRTFEQFLKEKKQNGFDEVDRARDYMVKSKATNATFLSKIFYLVAMIVEELCCSAEKLNKIRAAVNEKEPQQIENDFYHQCLLVQKVYDKFIKKPQAKTLNKLREEFEKLHAFAGKMAEGLSQQDQRKELEKAHKLINEVLSKHVGTDVAKEILSYFARSQFESQYQFMGNDLEKFLLNFDSNVNDFTSSASYGSAQDIGNVFLDIVADIGTKEKKNKDANFEALNLLTTAMGAPVVPEAQIEDYGKSFSERLKAILQTGKSDPNFLINENDQRTLITQYRTYCETKAQVEKEHAEFHKLFLQHNNKVVEYLKIQSAEIAVSYDTLVELFGEDPFQRPRDFDVPTLLTDVDKCKHKIASIDRQIPLSISQVQSKFQTTLEEKKGALPQIQTQIDHLSGQKTVQEKDLADKRAARDNAKYKSPGSLNIKSTPDQVKNFNEYKAAQEAVEKAKQDLTLTETTLNKHNADLAKLEKEIAANPAEEKKAIEAVVKTLKQEKKQKENELAQYKKQTVMLAKQDITDAYNAKVQSKTLFEEAYGENSYQLFEDKWPKQPRLEDVSLTEEGHGENSYKLFEDISKELKKHQGLVNQAEKEMNAKAEDLTNAFKQLKKAEKALRNALIDSGYNPETGIANLNDKRGTIKATILKERRLVKDLAFTVIGKMVKPKDPEEEAKANLQKYQARNKSKYQLSRDVSGYNNNRFSRTSVGHSSSSSDDDEFLGVGARERRRAVSLGGLPRTSRRNRKVKAPEYLNGSNAVHGDKRFFGEVVSEDAFNKYPNNGRASFHPGNEEETREERGRSVTRRTSRSKSGTEIPERLPTTSTNRANRTDSPHVIDYTGLQPDSGDEEHFQDFPSDSGVDKSTQ